MQVFPAYCNSRNVTVRRFSRTPSATQPLRHPTQRHRILCSEDARIYAKALGGRSAIRSFELGIGALAGNASVTDRLDVLCPFTPNCNKFSCVFNDTGNETEVEASVAIGNYVDFTMRYIFLVIIR